MMNKITLVSLIFCAVFAVLAVGVAVEAVFFEEFSAGFHLTYVYTDGTQKTITEKSFSISPYTLTDRSGNDIEQINVKLLVRLKSSKEIQSWRVVGTQQVEVYKSGDPVPKISSTIDVKKTVSLKESTVEVSFIELPWSDIQDAIVTYGEGEWSMQVGSSLTAEITFSDGSKKLYSGVAPHMNLDFNFVADGTQTTVNGQDSIQGLSLFGDLALATGIPMLIWSMLFAIVSFVCGGVAWIFREG